ncbi:MAG: hypothetical protein IJ509_02045 [Bacilli bacterium]|nr:hypothetical protein [Bacilli bacterium]
MGDKWLKILHYIENYRECYKSKDLDYYQIFELSKEMVSSDIAKAIKDNRFTVLFHPDLEKYIPKDYQTDFKILTELVRDMENTLCNSVNKERYDKKLTEEWQKKWELILHYINNYRHCYANRDLDYYKIFELPRNETAEEITKLLEENSIKALFNPKYKEKVPINYQNTFLNLTNLFLEMEKTLCNKEKKEWYDSRMKKKWLGNFEEVLHYIDNYRRCKNNYDLDYYNIFELPRDRKADEISRILSMRKFTILFNTDYMEYVPKDYQIDFMNMVGFVSDMENKLCNEESKKQYDAKLEKRKKRKEAVREANNSKKKEIEIIGGVINSKGVVVSNYNDFIDNRDKRDIDIIVSENIKKYGFQFTFDAIGNFIFEENSKGFTRDNNIREKIDKIGKQKLQYFLRIYSDDKQFSRDDLSTIIYYFNDLVLRDKQLKNKMQIFEQASIATISTNDIYGYETLVGAVRKFIEQKDYGIFSANLRQKLHEMVNHRDGKILVQMYLSSYRFDDFRYNYKNLEKLSDEELANEFSDFLSQQIIANEVKTSRKSSRAG